LLKRNPKYRLRLKPELLKRPTLTAEQDRVWRMVEEAGTPEGAAQSLFARLAALEAAVAEVSESIEEAPADAGAEPCSGDTESASEP